MSKSSDYMPKMCHQNDSLHFLGQSLIILKVGV